ncbi:RNA binding protein, heterogenous nuclear RNP-K like protein [Apophysomyces ossiformis]|uniref:RNA binding protein, heterogenous nuclear RNP-K like protein n=1 Tax=Apophysomyces ossiformis TaxID=679940 RepID=A0A8H7BUN5_9FUNG|nr:RNA binding protein, heterogenous nuclear RNP-K like protein [Apophysomyces ossiformis]
MSQASHTSSDQYDDRYSEQQNNANSSQVEIASVDQQFDSDDAQLTLRALVSTKEAGVIIGKGGKNVAELRDSTGVKAGVSKVVQGVHDRVLTVSGTLEGVAKAYSLIAQTLLDNPISPTTPPTTPTTSSAAPAGAVATIRLLISHNLMGTVIGRQGAKIKHIQDTSGVRMIASKTLLPQSTERVVEVRGAVDSVRLAVLEIGQCLIEDKERAYGTILYNPTKVGTTGERRASITRTGNGSDFSNPPPEYQSQRRASTSSQSYLNDPNIRTQHISIPSDMVGCIIGRGGSKISEIRRLSGSRISIARVPDDETGERMFTIQGTPESNERALYLLYGQLESEKERRLRGVMHEDILEEEEEGL